MVGIGMNYKMEKGGKMKMYSCIGCVYQSDKNKLLVNEYCGWASSQPHPCTTCIRFPRERIDYPDNFQKLKDEDDDDNK